MRAVPSISSKQRQRAQKGRTNGSRGIRRSQEAGQKRGKGTAGMEKRGGVAELKTAVPCDLSQSGGTSIAGGMAEMEWGGAGRGEVVPGGTDTGLGWYAWVGPAHGAGGFVCDWCGLQSKRQTGASKHTGWLR